MKIFRLVAIFLISGVVLGLSIFWDSLSTHQSSILPNLGCPVVAATKPNLSLKDAKCGLGERWEVNEGCWRGVYKRRGNSGVFDAEWTLLDGRSFTAEVTLSIEGTRVSGQRRKATFGGDCELENSTVGTDGVTVSGNWRCNHPEGLATSCFFALITCDGLQTLNLAGAWESNFQGSWKPTNIRQEGNKLWFTNEFGGTSTGLIESSTRVKASDWQGGLGATIQDENTIKWDNGSIWRRKNR